MYTVLCEELVVRVQYEIRVCEMINSLLETWLKYAGNMKFTLKYIHAQS